MGPRSCDPEDRILRTAWTPPFGAWLLPRRSDPGTGYAHNQMSPRSAARKGPHLRAHNAYRLTRLNFPGSARAERTYARSERDRSWLWTLCVKSGGTHDSKAWLCAEVAGRRTSRTWPRRSARPSSRPPTASSDRATTSLSMGRRSVSSSRCRVGGAVRATSRPRPGGSSMSRAAASRIAARSSATDFPTTRVRTVTIASDSPRAQADRRSCSASAFVGRGRSRRHLPRARQASPPAPPAALGRSTRWVRELSWSVLR